MEATSQKFGFSNQGCTVREHILFLKNLNAKENKLVFVRRHLYNN